jgi:broad specificity phosphatase PhoE
MNVYLIRHGEAEHNVTHNINQLDSPLTSLGIQQCQNNKVRYQDAQLVLTSTATRALQTAKQLFDTNDSKKNDKSYIFDNIPIYATDLLLEYNTGVPCNQRHSLDIQKSLYPDIDFDTYYVQPLSQELTWQDGEKRALQLINLLKTIKNNSTIAIVSHANFIRNIMQLLTGLNFELKNAESILVHIN